jgi:hypothetical protein
MNAVHALSLVTGGAAGTARAGRVGAAVKDGAAVKEGARSNDGAAAKEGARSKDGAAAKADVAKGAVDQGQGVRVQRCSAKNW